MVTGSCTQYKINGYQLRMSHCNQGTFLASAGSYTMVSLTEKRILCTGRSPCGFCDYRLYLFVSVSNSCAFFLPALSLLPGERPAQDERCFSEGKWDMSKPISETKSSTTLVLKPGISLRSSRAFSYFDSNDFMRSDKSYTRAGSGLYPFGSSEEDRHDVPPQNLYRLQAILQDWQKVYRGKQTLCRQE